jgi:hypothetical protein
MFCVLCRRLFWRDPKPVRAADKPKQSTRRPPGGGKDPKQCPGDGRAWARDRRSDLQTLNGTKQVWLRRNRLWLWIIASDGIMRRKR